MIASSTPVAQIKDVTVIEQTPFVIKAKVVVWYAGYEYTVTTEIYEGCLQNTKLEGFTAQPAAEFVDALWTELKRRGKYPKKHDLDVFQKAKQAVADFDAKYRRVLIDNIVFFYSPDNYEMNRLSEIFDRRPVGKYEVACVSHVENLEEGGNADLFEQYVKEFAKDVMWVIPAGDSLYDQDELAIVFGPL